MSGLPFGFISLLAASLFGCAANTGADAPLPPAPAESFSGDFSQETTVQNDDDSSSLIVIHDKLGGYRYTEWRVSSDRYALQERMCAPVPSHGDLSVECTNWIGHRFDTLRQMGQLGRISGKFHQDITGEWVTLSLVNVRGSQLANASCDVVNGLLNGETCDNWEVKTSGSM